jgi:hypothetical protein
VVGPSGGLVTQAGVMLDVPADAIPSATAITIATTTAPGGYTLASLAYQFGPSGTQFQQPVTVTIPLTSASAGVHLFWSNATGGFDDVGGTVTGSMLTAQVMHFSVGFCAIPSGGGGTGGSAAKGGASGSNGSGGGAGFGVGGRAGGSGSGVGGGTGSGTGGSASGAGGVAGGSGSGTAGSSGAAGRSGSGTAGSSGTGAAGSSGTGTAGSSGSTGAAGSSGAAGAPGPTDAGLSGDAAASLCKTVGLNLPNIKIYYPEGGVAAPDGSAYSGGTLASAHVVLLSATHYGGGPYTGAQRAQYTIDTTAHTIVIGEELPNAGPGQYVAMTYTVVSTNTLQVTVVCNTWSTPTGTFDMYYSVNGSQTTLTTVGSDDVLVIGPLNST